MPNYYINNEKSTVFIELLIRWKEKGGDRFII